ncbi:hypothetical protein HK104_004131 [Borealophlyctis nickersoniae]|nr:hypothetical protein HK104_004131 [Borealophlyctis nickersoniae]
MRCDYSPRPSTTYRPPAVSFRSRLESAALSSMEEMDGNLFQRGSSSRDSSEGVSASSGEAAPMQTDSALSTPPSAEKRDRDVNMIVGSMNGRGMMIDSPTRKPHLLKTKSLPALGRIATLLSEEIRPFEKEIAHERSLNSGILTVSNEDLAAAASGSPLVPDSPQSVHSNASFLMDDGSSEYIAVPVPVRAVAIPKTQIKDPAVYVSHSSKLNPENNTPRYYIITQPISRQCPSIRQPFAAS